MRKTIQKVILLILTSLMAVSCSTNVSTSSSSDSDFLSSLINGDSWSSTDGFSSHSDSSDPDREVTISFATGEGTPINPITIQAGYSFEEGSFEVPTRQHYEFQGWYLDPNYNLPIHYPFVASYDCVLYAKWVPIRHMIRFVTGTAQTMNPIYVQEGEYLQEPVPPSNGRKKFVGWYLNEELTEKAYFPYVVNAPVTFYAKYEAVVRTITFHVNGGSLITPLLVEEGEIITEPFESPTHPYFAFAGWYYDDQFATPVQYPFVVTENLNLFARWSDTEATITFATNGANSLDPVVITKGSTIRSLPSPELANAVFLGWYLDEELTNPVTLPFVAIESLTLYASWRIGFRRLSFETFEGTIMQPIDKTQGEPVEESEVATPTRSHYVFKGWYLDRNFTQPVTFPLVMSESIMIYAKWEAESYTVTFHSNGGSAVDSVSVSYGQSITSSPTTNRAGYEFVGWFIDSTLLDQVRFPLAVEGNMNLYAKWKEIVYAVSFNSNGAANYPSIEKRYGEMLEENEVPVPSKSRNNFLGWYLDFDLTQKAIFPIEIKDNLTLHAKWEYITTFSVRFDANGGSGGAYYVVENGASITAAPEPSRTGYTFAGWYQDQNCTIPAEFPFAVSESITFYAKWEAISCTLAYHTNGGNEIPSSNVAYGEVIESAPTPTKEGSVFLGWYLDEGLNTLAAFPIVAVENLSFYAKWREIVYCTVSFNNDGAIETVKVEKGGAIEEPQPPTKEGYTFAGWYLDAEYSVEANFPYLVTSSMTFFAKWQRNEGTVVVTFETNGGTSVDPITLASGGMLSEPSSPVSSRGEFLGWYLDSGFTNKVAFPMEVFANTTLYAKYASYEQTYTVSFDSRGGSPVASQIVYATGSLIAPPSAPTNLGYVFAGWYLDEAYTRAASFPMKIDEDITLFAKWDDDPSVYRIVLRDGVNSDNVYLLNPGDSLPRPADPTRQGYIFAGWYFNETGTGEAVSFPYVPNGDVTLYAKWTLEVVEYTVTWVSNDGNPIQEQTVDNGAVISGKTPSREGYDFLGWYTDEELTQKVSFPYQVNGDVTFYAKWAAKAITYTVTYQTNGGTAVPTSTVNKGGTISAPSTPTRSGYIFTGWYLDEECTQKASFPMAVENSFTLYAGWRVDEYASFTFEYNGTLGGYVLTDYEGDASSIVIPETYDDGIHGSAPVVSIGKSAFENCSSIVSIEIPDSVLSIGDSAFYGCSSLVSVTIPASVTELGTRTFYKCTSLEQVNLPDSISAIGSWSFYGCTSLSTIVLPAELRSISDYLFYSSGLERIVIHSNCKSIGNFAFYNCASLIQVDIAEGCASIGNNAFRGCASLRQITIPITVTSVGSYVFVDDEFIVIYCSHSDKPNGFDNLWSRTSSNPEVTSNAPVIYNYGGAYARDGDIVYALLKDGSVSATYIGSRDITSIVVKDQIEINEHIYDVTVIGTRGFRNLKSLQSITLPSKLQVIGSYAFQGCSALTQIVLPSSVLSIESYAFFNCSSLSKISFPSSLTSIGEYTFRNCTALKEVYLPRSVVSISSSAFSQCNGIVIMHGGNDAYFYDVEYIYLSNSAGKYYYQDGLYYSLTVNGNVAVSKADRNILSAVVLAQVTIDGVEYQVTAVDSNAFSGQNMLETVVLPDTIVTIGSHAFYGCSNLTSIDLGRGVNTIQDQAFGYCNQLRIIEVNSSLNTLGGSIFNGCQNHITLLVKGPAFTYDRYSLYIENSRYASIVFDYQGEYIVSDYVIYALTKGGVAVAGHNGTINSLTLRDSVEIGGNTCKVVSVADNAFSGMSDLLSLTLGNNIEVIGVYAFSYGEYKEVTLPDSVKKVGEYAFIQNTSNNLTIYSSSFTVDGDFNYSSIKRVYFGTVGPLFSYDGNDYGVTKDGGAILLQWNGSKSGEIALPESVIDGDGISRIVKAIGNDVFSGSTELTKITLPAGTVAICNNAFFQCSNLQQVVYQGDSLRSVGRAGFYGCYNLTSASFLGTVTSIGDNAFSECTGLTSIVLSDQLEEIGNRAFLDCYALQSIVIPNSVKRIGASAFYNCHNAQITLGSGIERIEENAFQYCAALNAIAFGDSLQYIGDYAFYNVQISYVYIPSAATIFSRSFTNGILCLGVDSLESSMKNTMVGNGINLFLGCNGIVYADSALYASLSSGEATLVRYFGSGSSFDVLPSITVKGINYAVTSIADKAFRDNVSLQKVTLSDNIEAIGSYAFANCMSLTEVMWGTGVKSIGSHAFESCANLKAFILPQGLTTVGDYAFAYISGATVFVPDSVTSIGKNAVANSSVFCVGDSVEGVSDANLPDCFIRTGVVALTKVDDFEYVLLSDNTAIALRYFGSEISVTMTNVVAYEGTDYRVTSLSGGLFANHAELEQVSLPSAITEISSSLFYGCTALDSITLPDGVVRIGDYAFYQCYALSSLACSDSVRSLGSYAFGSCNSLLTVDFGDSLVRVGDHAFDYCSSLKSANLGNNVETIGAYAFDRCSSLRSVSWGNALASIGAYAFYYCSDLTSVALPDSLVELGEYVFSYCSGLKTLTFGSGLKVIPNGAFTSCNSLTTLVLSNSIETISRNAFSDCNSLKSITFGTGLKTLEDYSFAWCYSLNNVVLPNGLTTLGNNVFESCYVGYAYVPSSVTSIGNNCFYRGTIYFGSSVLTNVNALSAECERFFNCSGIVTIDGLTYVLMKNGNASLASYNGSEKDVVIENFTYNGKSYEVVAIMDNAFAYSKITSVTFPDTLVSIGSGAFYECDYLASLTFPESLVSIGSNAFYNCDRLTSVVFPDSLTEIGANAFRYNYALSSITFGSGLEIIGEYAFQNSINMREVILPDGLTDIGRGAFADITLSRVFIPESVTFIGENCFTSDSRVYFEASSFADIDSIGNCTPSYNCAGLVIQDGFFYILSSDGTALLQSYDGSATEIVLSNIEFKGSTYKLTEIAASAFSWKTALTSITFNDDLKTIGSEAFRYCSNLSSVTFGAGLKEIGVRAFDQCTNLKSITLPNGLTTIGNYAFSGASLTRVYVPSNVTTLGDYCFSNTAVYAEAASFANENAAAGCTVTYNCAGVVEQNGFFFILQTDGTAKLERYYGSESNVVLPSTIAFEGKDYRLTVIGPNAFFQNSLASVTLPDSVETISAHAFQSCGNLASVTLGSGLKSIGDYAFNSCYSIRSITLPEGLTSIGANAFEGANLNYVFIPASLTTLGDSCFSSTRVYASAASFANENALNGCTVTYNCAGAVEINGVLYAAFKDGSATLIAYNGGETNVILPSSIELNGVDYQLTAIASYAFSNRAVQTVTLPSTLTSIGAYAFSHSSLTSIALPASLTEIGEHTFQNCASLATVTVSSGLTSIGDYAFESCGSLTAFALPEGLTYLGNYAFSGSGLTSISLPSTLTAVGMSAFEYCSSLASVDASSLESIGDNAFQHCSTLASFTFNEGLKSIGSYAFSDTAIVSLVVPSSVESIGSYAFNNCNSLVSATLNGGGTIGDYAFYYCTKLETVSFGANVLSIGERAFSYCQYLRTITFSSGLRSIGAYAFSTCYQLKTAILPEGLISIGAYTFEGCSLRYIYIPESAVNLGAHVHGNYTTVYAGAANLTNSEAFPNSSITYNCAGIYEENGFFYILNNNNTATLSSYSGDARNITLSSITVGGKTYSLTAIGSYAFNNRDSIETVALPSTLTSIGDYAFAHCNNLAKVILPESIQNIGQNVFYASGVRMVWLPSGLNSIGDGAFRSLMIVSSYSTIPNAFSSAFDNCTFVLSAKAIYDADAGMTFALFENGSATLLTYEGNAASVTIPNKITLDSTDYAVTAIRPNVFNGHTEIVSVSLPDSVVEIGESAFSNCASLTTIDLSHVQVIGDYAFHRTKLSSLILTSATRIGEYAFSQYEESKLSFVYLGDSIDYIGERAFASRVSEWVLCASSAKGDNWSQGWAWSDASTNVVWSCTGYTIDGSIVYYVTSTDNSLKLALVDRSATEVILGGTITIDGVEYTLEKISDYAFYEARIEEVTLTSTVTELGRFAFGYCSSLAKVTMESVETVGENAFSSCSSLTEVDMESVETIGGSAFSSCSSLARISLESVETIGSYAFSSCTTLEQVELGSALSVIRSYAFQDCKKLSSVDLPLGLTTLESGAFSGCTSLKALYVPQTVTTFSSQYNDGLIIMTPLASVNWDSELKVVCNATGEYFVYEDYLFAVNRNGKVTLAGYYGTEKDLVLPSSAINGGNAYEVSYISSNAFRYSDITSVVLPSTLSGIKQYAFYQCNKLTRVEILSGTNFDSYSFYCLNKLKMVILHDGVKISNSYVFQFDSDIVRPVFLVEASTSGWSSNFAYSWNGDLNYQYAVVENSTLATFEVGGVIYAPRNDGSVYVIGASEGVTSVILTSTIEYEGKIYGVTGIAATAFVRHLTLQEITIPTSVTYVGDGALANCYSLATVNWYASVSAIGYRTFSGDMMLHDIVLDNDMLTEIRSYAFYGCSSLESIILPANVNHIGSEAFSQCVELAHIHSRRSASDIIWVESTLPNDLSIEYGYTDE